MFEIPDSKRVRRADLYTSDHSAAEDSASYDTSAQNALRAQLAALYGPIETTPSTPPSKSQPSTQPAPSAEPEDEQEEEFDFNLFAPAAPNSVPAHGDADGMTIETPKKPQKIILEKDDDAEAPAGEGKLVRQRKDGWWMADITEARRAEYRDIAVGMEDIRKWAEMRHYGWGKPWKVRVIHTGLSPAELAGAARTAAIARKLQLDSAKTTGGDKMEIDEKIKSKTKPNKKRRIILRSREKAAKEAAEAARIKAEKGREKKLEEDKDYAVKRNARNRERKIKRREREKRKKEALKEGREFVDEGSEGEEEQKEGGNQEVVA